MARQIRQEAKQASAEARLQASALPIFRDRSRPAPDKDNLDILSFLLKREYSAVSERVERGDFDFDCFQRFVARSQLRGYVYSVLADSTMRSAFPARLVDDLHSSYARGKEKSENLLRELNLLSSKLSLAGQEFILLKGPYLAARFYGGIDRRTYWDIDVLVKRESLPQVQQLLTDSGYVRRSHVLVHEGEEDNRPDLNNRQTAARLITPSRFGLRNKLWAFRLYETSAMSGFLWWATSLPFRLVVYRPGKFSRFKRNIRRWVARRN